LLADGGDTADGAVSCSGGSRNDTCFSARLMWRTAGAGEMYTYLPPSYAANDAVCDVPPFSTCNPTDGASVARGSFAFAGGEWTTVSERVRLNDAGAQNGELELFVGGESMFSVGGLVLRDAAAGRIRGIMVQVRVPVAVRSNDVVADMSGLCGCRRFSEVRLPRLAWRTHH
jgi:hypothetical protein